MANFFNRYPKLLYGDKVVTDILARVVLREKYSNKIQLYYEYDLQEGDTPEIIASKYYGDPEYHWIVLFMNEIIDPVFDFPLSYSNFIAYLDDKFRTEGLAAGISGSEYAKITLNPDPASYRVIITTVDQITQQTTTNKFFIDSKAYSSQYQNDVFNFPDYTTQFGDMTYSQTTEPVYIFDYADEINESKRKIKLLRAEYASQVEEELESLMRLNYV
jgi:hypothetical protein